jgi:hypothetical protein
MLGDPLASLPIPKTSAFSNVDKDWQAQRRLASAISALYHNAMAHVVADVNELCLTHRHYCSLIRLFVAVEDYGTFSV